MLRGVSWPVDLETPPDSWSLIVTQRMAGKGVYGWMMAVLVAVPVIAQEHGDEPNLFLSSDIGNAFWSLVIFGLVVLLLGKFAFKPILNLLQQREAMIHDALVEAKREREEADQLLAQYRAQVDRAREEATGIVEEGKHDAETVRQRIHEEARQEATAMIERAKREIQLATDDAVKRVYDMTADVSVNIAGGIIGKELSAADHERFVSESLERIKASDEARFN